MSELTEIRSDYEHRIWKARIDRNTSKISTQTENTRKIIWQQNGIMTQSSKIVNWKFWVNFCVAFHKCVFFNAECAHQMPTWFRTKVNFFQFTRATFCTDCLIIIAFEFKAFKGIVGAHKWHVIFNIFLIFFPHLPFFRKYSLLRGRGIDEFLALCNAPLPIFPQLR